MLSWRSGTAFGCKHGVCGLDPRAGGELCTLIYLPRYDRSPIITVSNLDGERERSVLVLCSLCLAMCEIKNEAKNKKEYK